jgi:hypothetical protein
MSSKVQRGQMAAFYVSKGKWKVQFVLIRINIVTKLNVNLYFQKGKIPKNGGTHHNTSNPSYLGARGKEVQDLRPA